MTSRPDNRSKGLLKRPTRPCGGLLPIGMAGLLVLAGIVSADARVTRITIQNRQSPIHAGKSFGDVGAYETLAGLVHGEIDPKDPHNQIITDLQLAPRNARGRVEYTATFTLQKP